MPREIPPEQRTHEMGARELLPQASKIGAVAYDNLASWQIEVEEGLDVFLDGNAPHVNGNRPWQRESEGLFGVENGGIYTP
jgi:hypothetical protein